MRLVDLIKDYLWCTFFLVNGVCLIPWWRVEDVCGVTPLRSNQTVFIAPFVTAASLNYSSELILAQLKFLICNLFLWTTFVLTLVNSVSGFQCCCSVWRSKAQACHFPWVRSCHLVDKVWTSALLCWSGRDGRNFPGS